MNDPLRGRVKAKKKNETKLKPLVDNARPDSAFIASNGVKENSLENLRLIDFALQLHPRALDRFRCLQQLKFQDLSLLQLKILADNFVLLHFTLLLFLLLLANTTQHNPNSSQTVWFQNNLKHRPCDQSQSVNVTMFGFATTKCNTLVFVYFQSLVVLAPVVCLRNCWTI